jgi:futalosine hydrolase
LNDGWSLADFVFVHAAALERPRLAGAVSHRLGVGKVAAAMALTALLHEGPRPRAVLLCGVAGAYPARHRRTPPPLALTAVGIVGSDVLADEGVATPEGFLDLGRAEPGPALVDVGPFAAAPELVQFAAQRLAVPIVRGATVSTCSGVDALSAARHEHTAADVETMEGAAVAAVCQRFGVPLLQLRAISNWTGDRERGEWNLAAAMAALQAALVRLFAAG